MDCLLAQLSLRAPGLSHQVCMLNATNCEACKRLIVSFPERTAVVNIPCLKKPRMGRGVEGEPHAAAVQTGNGQVGSWGRASWSMQGGVAEV